MYQEHFYEKSLDEIYEFFWLQKGFFYIICIFFSPIYGYW